MSALEAVVAFVIDTFESAWAVYSGGAIVGLALAVFLLDRIVRIFDILKH